ncbi:MAG TPA: hypothetical protein VNJ71_08540 [Gemmatimonadales bacterium]|nr:hypothetical protein [Gemmatimonadales bacterium]
MSEPEPNRPAFEPRYPRLAAFLVTVASAFTLLYPLLGGAILFGGQNSDMLVAGYSFRLFGAEEFRATGAIPQWNPYLFGGLPYIAAMHGDIFYPTAWLRWVMPVDLAITWGMALHFVLAGFFGYLLARRLEASWSGAVVAGVAYQLSGIVASQVSPGHDGKLFVSALAPLAFLALLEAIRHGKAAWYGGFAVIVGLCVLSPHYQMTYFLLLALGLWTLYLAVLDPERKTATPPWRAVAWAAVAVVVGVGIAGLQILPFLEYIPYSPRAAGGPNTGWAYANLFSMPPEEIVTAVLPEFNGVLDNYWGRNPFKFHTEYLGAVVLMLACLAWGVPRRRRLLTALGVLAVVFLLLAFAGHTPFYRPFYEFMPMLKKLRAMGMVFYLVALPVALMAGLGADRLLAGQVSRRGVGLLAGGFGLFALLGVAGVLQVLAEGLATPERMGAAQANAPALRAGAARLLAASIATGAVMWWIGARRLGGLAAALTLAGLATLDLWSVDRRFFAFSPRAAVLFGQDDVTRHLATVRQPYRVLDFGGVYRQSSILMAYRTPDALGYHGNELRFYDELGGKDRGWANLGSRNLLDLLAVRFILLDRPQPIPGYHQVLGPVSTAFGTTAVLYERDSVPPYARVLAAAAKLPEAQTPPTVADPRFPVDRVVIYPETATVAVPPLRQPFPASPVRAEVAAWAPGRMTVSLSGADTSASYLLVSENWYPDWRVTVDGQPAQALRGDHTLLSVVLPPGARRVEFRFDSPAYARGKVVSLMAGLAALALLVVPALRARRRASA